MKIIMDIDVQEANRLFEGLSIRRIELRTHQRGRAVRSVRIPNPLSEGTVPHRVSLLAEQSGEQARKNPGMRTVHQDQLKL